MTKVRGIRGATTAEDNTREAILGATKELLEELVEANDIKADDVAAAYFTTTQDLNAEFPAVAARVRLGWQHTALMSSHEIPVPGAPASVIRIMLLVNTDKGKDDLVHVYLKGARNLRGRGTTEQ